MKRRWLKMARDSASGAQVKVTSILGSSESRLSSQQIRGGRVSVLFGSGDIDLRQAALANGEAGIKIFPIFGGTKIAVPEDWDVNVQAGAVFGGVDYKRTVPPSPTSQLTLTGFCLFGGIEIRS
jgi:hypothetical protein